MDERNVKVFSFLLAEKNSLNSLHVQLTLYFTDSYSKIMSRLEFLDQLSGSTASAYRSALKRFFKTILGREGDLEDLAEAYFREERDFERDVQNFFTAIKDMAPKTQRVYISILRTFLLENGVELRQVFWRRLSKRIKGSRALTEDHVPSNEDLRKIMMHLPIHGKALFLTLASSGMRIGEALQLKIEDVDLDSDPVKVLIRGEYTKTGNKRITFISREAKEAILEWLKIRDEYLKTAVRRSRNKLEEDSRIFPFSETNARHMWNLALKKTGNHKRDRTTKIHAMHPHVLRKFFRSKMGTVIPVDVVEALMGHEGYLTEVYRKYPDPEKTLAEFYKKGEHVLLVFTESAEVSKLKEEIEEKNKQLQELISNIVQENLELKKRLKILEEKVKEIRELLGFDKLTREEAEYWYQQLKGFIPMLEAWRKRKGKIEPIED